MNQRDYVSLQNVHFSYTQRAIFAGINVAIKAGKITAILGPSGTGKTTLLRLIAAQLQPDTGSVIVNGQNVHALTQEKLYAARREMGLLFQNGALFTGLSVFENVAFPLRMHTNLTESMIRDLVLLKLQAVGLRGAQHLQPNELSGGMARRVALARAIALDPKLIMYDEPFAGQDPISMGVLVKLIRLLNDSLDITSIIVSHDVAVVFSLADYVYILSEGKVIGQGTPEVLSHEAAPKVKQFLQGLPVGPVLFHYPAMDYTQDLLRGDL